MVFLIRDNYILAHGTKWDDDDIIKMFRDEADRLLSASCTVYVNDQPVKLSQNFPEKVDDLAHYLHKGTNLFKFRWHGSNGQVDEESVIHLQAYEM